MGLFVKRKHQRGLSTINSLLTSVITDSLNTDLCPQVSSADNLCKQFGPRFLPTVNLVLVCTVKNNYFSLCTN